MDPCVSFACPMPIFDYRYELRRGEEVIATGRLTRDRPFEVGERIEIGGSVGTVRAVEPVLGERELRLVVQLWREAAVWVPQTRSAFLQGRARVERVEREEVPWVVRAGSVGRWVVDVCWLRVCPSLTGSFAVCSSC